MSGNTPKVLWKMAALKKETTTATIHRISPGLPHMVAKFVVCGMNHKLFDLSRIAYDKDHTYQNKGWNVRIITHQWKCITKLVLFDLRLNLNL